MKPHQQIAFLILFFTATNAHAFCTTDTECPATEFCHIEKQVQTETGELRAGQCRLHRHRIPGTNFTVYDRDPHADEWMLGKSRAHIDAELSRRGQSLDALFAKERIKP